MTNRLPLIVLAAVPLATAPMVGRAQVAPAAPRSVTLVLKERFTRPDLAAVVRRTAGPNPESIIALKRSAATPELLATALVILEKSVERLGNTPPRKLTVVIPDGLRQHPVAAAERPRFAGAIDRLLGAPPRAVPGVGNVPAITMDLAQ